MHPRKRKGHFHEVDVILFKIWFRYIRYCFEFSYATKVQIPFFSLLCFVLCDLQVAAPSMLNLLAVNAKQHGN